MIDEYDFEADCNLSLDRINQFIKDRCEYYSWMWNLKYVYLPMGIIPFIRS